MACPSWEQKKNNSVWVFILHTDNVTFNWALGLRRLQYPGGDPVGITGMPFDHARNTACRTALDNGAEWLFFLDSDVVPPPDTIIRLMRHNLPVVSGIYCRRSPPAGVPVMMKPVGQWVTQFPPNALIEVDVVGAGCLLIHRSVLERLPPQRREQGKHWFDWRVDCREVLPMHECLSEDFTFCTAVRKQLGIKVMVDTSIQCGHIGYAESRYATFVPLGSLPPAA